jgi:spermidine synthase
MAGLALLFACFFVSGAFGLMYEVVWLRMLGLIFGHTVYAITTVLAAFMGGLALGSFLLGRCAPRIRNLIGAYGVLEIAIGLYCALTPMLLRLASSLYLALNHTLGLSYNAFSVVQFLLIFALLLVPTTLMGGTLPILSQALVKQEVGIGRTISALYAVNTFGAVTGVALAGYILLPALGNRTTTMIAAIGNVVVGVLAIGYSRRQPTQRPHGLQAQAQPGLRLPISLGIDGWLILVAFGVSGAVSMAYEIGWTRALALVIGALPTPSRRCWWSFLPGSREAARSTLAGGSRTASLAVFAVLRLGSISFMAILLVFERMRALFCSLALVELCILISSRSALVPPASSPAHRGHLPVRRDGRHAGSSTRGVDVGRVYREYPGSHCRDRRDRLRAHPTIGVHASIKLGIACNLVLAAALFAAKPRMSVVWPWGSVAAALVGAAIFFVPQWIRVMSSGPVSTPASTSRRPRQHS